MSTAKTKRAKSAPRRPEKKYGPFAGGCGVVVWLNEVQTDAGPRFFRSISLQPRRYRDKKTGVWKDAGSLRVTDIPAIVLGLDNAQEEDPWEDHLQRNERFAHNRYFRSFELGAMDSPTQASRTRR